MEMQRYAILYQCRDAILDAQQLLQPGRDISPLRRHLQCGLDDQFIVTRRTLQRHQPPRQHIVADYARNTPLPPSRQLTTAAEPQSAQGRSTTLLAQLVQRQTMAQHLGFVQQTTPPPPILAVGQQTVDGTSTHGRQGMGAQRWWARTPQIHAPFGGRVQVQPVVTKMVVESLHELTNLIRLQRVGGEVEGQELITIGVKPQRIGMQHVARWGLARIGECAHGGTWKIPVRRAFDTKQREQRTRMAMRLGGTVGTRQQRFETAHWWPFGARDSRDRAEQPRDEKVADQTVS